MAARYTIGIDLGTTNCAFAYVDTEANRPASEILELAQQSQEDAIVEATTLPSFLYLPPESSAEKQTVGIAARDRSATTPGRVIHSAKSWLCQQTSDPREPLLPWGSTEVEPREKRSPVDVSARYLVELKRIWEAAKPDADFTKQEITITVPASFDEAAQAATLEAARVAGYPAKIRLLEEPQAAFYAYLESQDNAVRTLVEKIPELANRAVLVLVCDIGGGTTDFSLFAIQAPQARQRVPRIDRIAVSDHLLLGGDNIDLALARLGEQRLGRKLTPRQWNQLVALARGLKERVLASPGVADETFHLTLAGSGASLMQAALSVTLRRDEILTTVREGFFPLVDKTERPRAAHALREWGLPFASDSAVTRHLAAFLQNHAVDAVLFNGGTLQPSFLRERIAEQITLWQNGRAPVVLENSEMDLAVARGAASYGAILRRSTGRIRGGYPHAVYLELSRASKFEPGSLVCVIPRGFEPGDRLKIDQLHFQLLIGEPVQFQLLYSNTTQDEAGSLRRSDGTFHALPPLQTKLTLPPGEGKPANGRLDIRLEVTLSETGLLQLACVTTSEPRQRWQLDFNLRKSAGEPGTESETADLGVPKERLQKALAKIELFYGKKKTGEVRESPKVLKHELTTILGQARDDWNLALLRSLWNGLQPGVTKRVRSEAHDVTWLYLAGFCLRPGYGSDLDRFRIDELWRVFGQGPLFPKNAGNMNQWWILWRRVAGGLDAERQSAVYEKIVGFLRAKPEPNPEVVLLAGSLERLSPASKAELGQLLLRRLGDRKTVALDQVLWALGRVANRVPLYAGDTAALDPKTVSEWVEKALALAVPAKHTGSLTLFLSQACALTGDRARDIEPELRERVLRHMRQLGAAEETCRRLEQVVDEDRTAQARLFGETLPAGIQLVA